MCQHITRGLSCSFNTYTHAVQSVYKTFIMLNKMKIIQDVGLCFVVSGCTEKWLIFYFLNEWKLCFCTWFLTKIAHVQIISIVIQTYRPKCERPIECTVCTWLTPGGHNLYREIWGSCPAWKQSSEQTPFLFHYSDTVLSIHTPALRFCFLFFCFFIKKIQIWTKVKANIKMIIKNDYTKLYFQIWIRINSLAPSSTNFIL